MASGVISAAREQRWLSYGLLLIALWFTLMLLVIKVWIGWATHSLGLISAALHTLVTGFSLLLSLITLSTPYACHRELWGHGRLESSLTLIMAGFLGFASCNLLVMAGQEVRYLLAKTTVAPNLLANSMASWVTPAPFQIDLAVFQVLGGISAIAFLLALIGRYQAKVVNNTHLGFSFNQSLVDAGVMWGILLGWLGMAAGLRWLDLALTGMVILMVMVSSYRLLNRQLPALLRQVAIAPEALTRSIRQVEGILHCYGLQSRGLVGRQIYVEMHLILHPECLTVAPIIIDRVERIICQHYGPAQVVVHIDGDRLPSDKPTAKKNKPIEK
jgi:divalent metal cation (Fe/Co/Zn/Cd) transporter